MDPHDAPPTLCSTPDGASDPAAQPLPDEPLTTWLRAQLLQWFDANRRDLPWRHDPSPYGVWVSEIMLQQTQVATVKGYYTRWMARFPDVEALAKAPIEEVIQAWAGLGYYRRARFMHAASKHVHEQLGGVFPDTVKGLRSLPGVGPYTAGAIASIAFGRAAALVDGNVERVFARLFAIPGDPKRRANQKRFWAIAATLVDPGRPGDFNQALMELGATVCSPRRPTCMLCPVRARCQALATGSLEQFPAKVKRAKAREVDVLTLVIFDPQTRRVLLARRPPDGLLPGLLEFPTLRAPLARATVDASHDWAAMVPEMLGELGVSLSPEPSAPSLTPLEHASHTFSHLKMRLHVLATARPEGEVALAPAQRHALLWTDLEALAEVALSGAQRKVEAIWRARLEAERS